MDSKKKMREDKEIAYLEKEKKKPQFVGYIFLFLFVVTIAYLVDEVSTNIGKFMELDVAVTFFGTKDSYNTVAVNGLIGTIITVISGTAMLLRPLADRFGRKIFLFIYTFGMAVGMGIIGIATSIPGWVIGTLLIQICIPHDMQQVYIQECAPKEKRGTYFSIIKGIATIGLILVPVLRFAFKVGESGNEQNWRYVYLGTAIIGFVAAILAVIFMRESDVYIENRLHQLRMSEKERLEAKKAKSDEAKRGGIINGVVHLFKHKQLRWLTISMALAMIAYVLTDHYSAIIGIGVLQAQGATDISSEMYQSAVVSNTVTSAVFIYPIGCGLVEFLPGIIADKIGRKKTSIIFAIIALVSYVAFYLGTKYFALKSWGPYFIGFFLGAACGGVWSFGDLLLLMVSESTETNLRVSANTSCLFIAGICYAICKAVEEAICKNLGDKMMGIITIIIVIIGLSTSIVTTMLKTKETKNSDLHKVSAKDFE